jgi:hypothetical protein
MLVIVKDSTQPFEMVNTKYGDYLESDGAAKRSIYAGCRSILGFLTLANQRC